MGREILDDLFQKQKINIRRGHLFDTPPTPMPVNFDLGRVEGMMLGLAIGDSLGNTTESWLPSSRAQTFGEIRDYLPNHYAGGRAIGVPSDDTQLAFWTLDQLIVDQGLNPEHLALRFSQDMIFGIGSTVKEFLRNFRAAKPWYECGPRSAGNGALMRIAPMLIPHLKTATVDLWVDTALSAYEPRTRQLDFKGPLWRFMEKHVSEAYDKGLTVKEACDKWYSGAYLLETVPCGIYILMRHCHDPEEAIVRAVNDTKDNDTVAAIVGAAVGALHGKSKLPERWIHKLSGRTKKGDDGRVFELLKEAEEIWG